MSHNNRYGWELAAKVRSQLRQQSQSFTLEERLENYQQWILDNANATPEQILWHKGQIILIKQAISDRES